MNSTIIDDFFSRYASTMNNALFGDKPDLDFFAGSFSEFVVGANPVGVAGGKNDTAFRDSIARGIDFYQRTGVISMNIVSKEVTALDQYHTMVRVFWKCLYDKNNLSGEIPFEVVYLVQVLKGSPKIFAYVTGDEQAAFRAHNLIPG